MLWMLQEAVDGEAAQAAVEDAGAGAQEGAATTGSTLDFSDGVSSDEMMARSQRRDTVYYDALSLQN